MSYSNTPRWPAKMSDEIQWPHLTALEQSLLTLLAADCSYTEIVQRIPKKGNPDQRYSEHYIAHKISNLYKKIGVRSKSGAVDWYHKYAFTTASLPATGEPVVSSIPPTQTEGPPRDAYQSDVAATKEHLDKELPVTKQKLLVGGLPTLILLLWALVGLVVVTLLIDPLLRATPSDEVVPIEFNVNFFFAFLVGVYGAVLAKQCSSILPLPFHRGIMCLSLGALFWVMGELLVTVALFGEAQMITFATFDLSDYFGYLLHNGCLVAMAYFIAGQQLDWRRHRQWNYRLLWAWLLINGMVISFFYGWEVQRYQNPTKFFYDIYYPLTDSITIALLFRCLWSAQSDHTPAQRILTQAVWFLQGACIALWLADLLFGVTTSLPPTHPLAYQNSTIVDLFYSMTFVLQGIALLWIGLGITPLDHDPSVTRAPIQSQINA